MAIRAESFWIANSLMGRRCYYTQMTGRGFMRTFAVCLKGQSLRLEFRVRNTLPGPRKDGETNEWRRVLSNATSEVDEHGKASKITGFLTDITHHKRMKQLPAHCFDADKIESIALSNQSFISDHARAAVVDATQTIVLCPQHQKRIVDDILTFSKFNSNLLLISPDPVQPVALTKMLCRCMRHISATLESKLRFLSINLIITVRSTTSSLIQHVFSKSLLISSQMPSNSRGIHASAT